LYLFYYNDIKFILLKFSDIQSTVRHNIHIQLDISTNVVEIRAIKVQSV
jgi:hypothetical protein